MSSPLPTLLRALQAVALCLTVLCLLAQPVLEAAHAAHDAGHAHAGASAGDEDPEPLPDAGSLDRLVHDFDCCLHATALPAPTQAWSPSHQPFPPPQANTPLHAPSPPSKLLRPPIAA